MKLGKWLSVGLALAMLLSAWWVLPPGVAQAAANPAKGPKTVNFTVTNQSGAPVTVQLTGSGSYTFAVASGQRVTMTVAYGNYQYSYMACGGTQKGTLAVPAVKKLNTLKCVYVTVTIYNATPGPFSLTLTGPGTYHFEIPQGVTKIHVLKGNYTFLAHTQYCHGTTTGIVSAKYYLTNGVKWPFYCSPIY